MVDRSRLVAFGRFVTDWEQENSPVDGNPPEEEFHAKAREILGEPEPGTAPTRVPYTRGGRPI
ncbi:hypothetical protein [Streptosporangium canum]|uniref:hypothetical protein n=1 Tax=Streptosporangium canum TaxID=324952 RepID=UPI0033AEEBE3